MMKYIYIIIFLLTHDLTELKEYWRVEFMKIKKEFRWYRLLRMLRKNENKYLFWYRLAYVMKRDRSERNKRTAEKINNKLKVKYTIDISLSAEIGIGLIMYHYYNIVITSNAKIGKRLIIKQGVTLGQKNAYPDGDFYIHIGDYVTIGANSVILGGKIRIGNNVSIGAMSFINKDIPDDCTVYTEKKNRLTIKPH